MGLKGQDTLYNIHHLSSEHLMLLDLGRNDAGKVSKIDTVKVTESFIIERYSHVMHIVSNVLVNIIRSFQNLNLFLLVSLQELFLVPQK